MWPEVQWHQGTSALLWFFIVFFCWKMSFMYPVPSPFPISSRPSFELSYVKDLSEYLVLFLSSHCPLLDDNSTCDFVHLLSLHSVSYHTHTHTHTQCQPPTRVVQNHLDTSQCSRTSLLRQLLPSNHRWAPGLFYDLFLLSPPFPSSSSSLLSSPFLSPPSSSSLLSSSLLFTSPSSTGFRPALVCLERLRDNPPCQPVQLPHAYYQHTDAFLATSDN